MVPLYLWRMVSFFVMEMVIPTVEMTFPILDMVFSIVGVEMVFLSRRGDGGEGVPDCTT